MKILLYGINFSPELTGIGKYTGEMAAWLVARGHSVRVVTAPPYYPGWRADPSYCGPRQIRRVWEGVQVWRAPLWVPSRPSGLKRLLHLASFAACSFPLMLWQLTWRPEVVWLVEPPLFCAPTALLVARLCGSQVWLHVQDFEVDAAFSLGLLKGERKRRLVVSFEGWLMRRFDRISTISMEMVRRALGKGVKRDRVIFFPNWTDLDAIRPLQQSSGYRAQLGISESDVVALYSGNMGGKQGLDMLAHAARLLVHERTLQFVFCGDGGGKLELQQMVEGLPNVRFIELQPLERLSELLGLADIHLLPQRADAAGLVMPSKLTGMMASGRAIVALAEPNTELGRVVGRCGVVVPPGSPQAFADAIRSLLHDAERRAELGVLARRYAESSLGKESILSTYEKALAASVAA
jgi:colanic acid biosynthesis glycosyl transferase WcaI